MMIFTLCEQYALHMRKGIVNPKISKSTRPQAILAVYDFQTNTYSIKL